MTDKAFLDKYNEYIALVDETLEEYLSEEGILPLLKESMHYSVFSGGKRIRPALLLATCAMTNGRVNGALPLAAGIEMIHAYSLIHDDLPAIDNDTLRRGKDTNHVVFGEALAILAGDGLLNYAYEKMLEGAAHVKYLDNYVKAIAYIARQAGAKEMIAGQVEDISHEGDVAASIDVLDFIHDKKTGGLFRASVLSGAMINKADDSIINALKIYADALGMAFQITDDILDVKGGEKLGKTAGKDEEAGKLTFVRVYGIDGAEDLVEQKCNDAIEALKDMGNEADFLRQVVYMVKHRDH